MKQDKELDKLLAKYLSQAGKGFLYKMMRKKNITLMERNVMVRSV